MVHCVGVEGTHKSERTPCR